ncbi:MAG: NAD kinase [Erysipelotrichaceae bacterium]|jgi:NAD+ kinase|nr:NAD kinase [Erysipelotrichaceae bacterium]
MTKYQIVIREDDHSKEVAEELNKKLKKAGFKPDFISPEIIFCIGGDGCFLAGVHQFLGLCETVGFIGIHTGTLGFFTQYAGKEIDRLIKDLTTKKPKQRERRLLEVEVGDRKLYAVNEVRVENPLKTQLIDVQVGKEKMETFRGTGLCISTQLGSTAYNRSNHGAVIHPDLEILQLTEVTGIHHRLFESLQAPLVLSEKAQITLSANFAGAQLCYDHLSLELNDQREIKAKLADKTIRFLDYRPYDYVKRLKNLF